MKTPEHAQDATQQACRADLAQTEPSFKERRGIAPLSCDCFGPKSGTGLEKKQKNIGLRAELFKADEVSKPVFSSSAKL